MNRYVVLRIHDENLSHYYRVAFLKLLAENSGLQKEVGKKNDEKKMKKGEKIGNFSRKLSQYGVFFACKIVV